MKPIFLLLISLCLAACASMGPKPSQEAMLPREQLEQHWEQHEATLSHLSDWTLKGKAAVSSGTKGGTANVIWIQHQEGYDIELYGLLGHGRTHLIAKGQEVRLVTQEGPEWLAADAQSLLGEYTGWYLPVDNLYYWVRGIPAPTTITSLKLNNQGQLAELQQAGWTVIYSEYAVFQGLWLPTRITLKYPGDAFQPPLTVKWLSKEWVISVIPGEKLP
ncbi:MAG: lipoprotein insertase outer membrane protein LolB [Gammaproteobacteria bacterium]